MDSKLSRLFTSDFISEEERQKRYDAESAQPSFGEKMREFEENRLKVNEIVPPPFSGIAVRTFQD